MGTVVPDGEVLVEEQEGEAFVLHVPSGRYFGLNRSGLVIWRAIVAGDDPVAALAARWPATTETQRRADVDALVTALLAAGLVRVEANARTSP